MRVTIGMLTGSVQNNLLAGSERLLESQARAASGKRINRPSDDVAGTTRAIGLRSALSAVEQFDRNSKVASSQLKLTSATLDTVVKDLRSVYDLGMQAASDALGADARSGIVAQLDRISEELLAIANTQALGKYIFAGSTSTTKPVDANPAGDPPYVFNGNNQPFKLQVAPGVTLTANVTADQVFNMNSAAVPGTADVFSVIKTLKEKVLSGNVKDISAQLENVKVVQENAISVRSQVGARQNRLDACNEALLDSKVSIEDLLSATEDIDLTEAVLDLQTKQNAYQAALTSASRVLQMSTLADFLS